MMLDFIDENAIAAEIRKATADVVEKGEVRTYDMMKMRGKADVVENGAASTKLTADAIIAKL